MLPPRSAILFLQCRKREQINSTFKYIKSPTLLDMRMGDFKCGSKIKLSNFLFTFNIVLLADTRTTRNIFIFVSQISYYPHGTTITIHIYLLSTIRSQGINFLRTCSSTLFTNIRQFPPCFSQYSLSITFLNLMLYISLRPLNSN